MWLWTNSPEEAPDTPEYIEIEYKNGDPIAIPWREAIPSKSTR